MVFLRPQLNSLNFAIHHPPYYQTLYSMEYREGSKTENTTSIVLISVSSLQQKIAIKQCETPNRRVLITCTEKRVKQHRQCTYNVTLRRVRESLLPWKSNKYCIFVRVCVCAHVHNCARARRRVHARACM